MFSPRTGGKAVEKAPAPSISPVLAAELAMEFAALRTRHTCPEGTYVTSSPASLLYWHGVFFAHHGPYRGSVLRFSLIFSEGYPRVAPVVKFDTDVYHPMVDPKTMIWSARGGVSRWQPEVHHISNLLHALKDDFTSSALATVSEEEATNRQIWSLYHYSHHTFLSMTAQRSLSTSSPNTLYPSPTPPPVPGGAGPRPESPAKFKTPPSTPTRSIRSSKAEIEKEAEEVIKFRRLEVGEGEVLRSQLQKSLRGA